MQAFTITAEMSYAASPIKILASNWLQKAKPSQCLSNLAAWLGLLPALTKERMFFMGTVPSLNWEQDFSEVREAALATKRLKASLTSLACDAIENDVAMR